MDFFKRHYEKFILLGLFVLFMVLMLYVLSIIQDTRSISERDLKLPPRVADHVTHDPEAKEFDPAWLLDNTRMKWEVSSAREAVSGNDFSDLVKGFKIAFCPGDDQENGVKPHLVPVSAFGNNKVCPICGRALPLPSEAQAKTLYLRGQITANDSDGDGISNADEATYKLDPQNPADALYDIDGDGFSNYYEIVNGVSPIDPFSHPPFWYRLSVGKIEKVQFPVRVMVFNDRKSDDKSVWEIQYNITSRSGSERTDWGGIGKVIRVEGRGYKIVDMKRNYRKVMGEFGENVVDESTVYIEELPGDMDGTENTKRRLEKLTMEVGKPVYLPERRVFFVDHGVPGGRNLKPLGQGALFRINGVSGEALNVGSNYIVSEIDVENNTVILMDADDKGSKPAVVNKNGMIPEDCRVTVKEKDGSRGDI